MRALGRIVIAATLALAAQVSAQELSAQEVASPQGAAPQVGEAPAAAPAPTVSYEDVQALIDRMQKQVEAMSSAASERDKALKFLEEQIDKATNRIEGTSETADALKERAANLDLQVEGLSQERAKLSTTVDERAQLVADLQQQVARLSSVLDGEKLAKTGLEQTLADERAARNTAEQKLASLEQEAALARKDLEGRIEQRQAALGVAEGEVRTLNEQLAKLTTQITAMSRLLDNSEGIITSQQARIGDLGAQLNQALAAKVEELSRYRSDFFGRLKQALGERPEFRVVGDRFVLQSELLFASGSATIGPEGLATLREIAKTLREVAQTIPADLDWIFRVDGHTDVVPVGPTSRFASNWELSTSRAISVVEVLVREGIPPQRLAATGFGEFRPLDPRDDEIGYRRNRRIEFKLSSS